LVFDEIDSGISGRVADIVGKKIQELSRSFQVICISHLPQVACYADAHFKAEKKLIGKRTESHVFKLDASQRIEEMARLLSGDKITAESMANAARFLEQSKDSLSKAATLSQVQSPAGHKPRVMKSGGMVSPSL
jgi:DNA repair protein RecN (Recombination protein N)